MHLGIEDSFFASQLSREIITGGLTVVDAIERILSEWLEDSVLQSIGDRIIKAPRAIIHPNYYKNRFQNLHKLGQKGYSTWYSEVRFSTHKDDHLDISYLETTGLKLGAIKYGRGVEKKFVHRRKELKTQVNHTIRLNNIKIPCDVFIKTISEVEKSEIIQPNIANLTVGFENFIDDRIEGFRTVSFDHVVTGERKFCGCHFDAHAAMLKDAKVKVPNYVHDSWPHRVINLLENSIYSNCLCHFCLAARYGEDAPIEWYGPQIRKHFEPYVDLLVRSTNMDSRTAKVEAKRRLSISRWLREDDLYQLVTQLFPSKIIRREASPSWLGRQRLDIYLPELALAIEHQGEQHYFPVKAFGGEYAFEKTRERDTRKRVLCQKNGVTVVDVRFDQPLTIPNLRFRLKRWIE